MLDVGFKAFHIPTFESNLRRGSGEKTLPANSGRTVKNKE